MYREENRALPDWKSCLCENNCWEKVYFSACSYSNFTAQIPREPGTAKLVRCTSQKEYTAENTVQVAAKVQRSNVLHSSNGEEMHCSTSTTKPSATTYEGRSAGCRTRSLCFVVGVGSFSTTLYGCDAGLVSKWGRPRGTRRLSRLLLDDLAHDLDGSRVWMLLRERPTTVSTN